MGTLLVGQCNLVGTSILMISKDDVTYGRIRVYVLAMTDCDAVDEHDEPQQQQLARQTPVEGLAGSQQTSHIYLVRRDCFGRL